MKYHNTKQEAKDANKKFAEIVKKASEETGADFLAEGLDDTGLEYYVESAYRNKEGRISCVKTHFQELDL